MGLKVVSTSCRRGGDRHTGLRPWESTCFRLWDWAGAYIRTWSRDSHAKNDPCLRTGSIACWGRIRVFLVP